jgi:hypothetical protein
MRMPEGPQRKHLYTPSANHPRVQASFTVGLHSRSLLPTVTLPPLPISSPHLPKKTLPFQETYYPLTSSIQARPLAG